MQKKKAVTITLTVCGTTEQNDKLFREALISVIRDIAKQNITEWKEQHARTQPNGTQVHRLDPMQHEETEG